MYSDNVNSNRIAFFMHPVPALAMVGMAVNDHYLKRAYPSWFTGKLSDFLGVFFFPLFLSAIVVLLARVKFTRPLLAAAMGPPSFSRRKTVRPLCQDR
jgi:hypothetical protein